MTPDEFNFISGMLKTRSGLVLTQDKMYLLESRLTPVARKRGMGSLTDLLNVLRRNPPDDLVRDVTEAMTTNESFFFRDSKPFDQFRDIVLPHLIETRRSQRHFRIWSAASSTGQEPYSLCMLLREAAAKLQGWRHEIIGTDLSTEVLARAREGIYTQFEVQRGLPITLLIKYFTQVEDSWQINKDVRSMVDYRPFNLLENMTPLGKFDVVYCRNVLIYFDQETKRQVLERMANQMTPDAFLFLGGAETVLGITDRFKPVAGHRGIYTKSESNFVPPPPK